MKGFIPIEIPTKKYLKAYILAELGPKPILDSSHTIGNYLHVLLQHSTNERATVFASRHYTEMVKIYIPISLFRQRGANLNETNIKCFNIFIENELKKRYRKLMDDLIEMLPNFMANLPEVRRKIGIDIEAWPDDSIKKDYYRYRLATGKSLLYTKYFNRSYTQNVPQ